MGKKMIIKGLNIKPNVAKTFFNYSDGSLKTGYYWINGTYMSNGGDSTKLLTIQVKSNTRLGVYSGASPSGWQGVNQIVFKKGKDDTTGPLKTVNYTSQGQQLNYMDITEDGYVDISFDITVSPLDTSYYSVENKS